MQVQQNNNQQKRGIISQVAVPALAGGLIAQSCQELLLPADVKFALKNTRCSQDKFIANVTKTAQETIENINASRAVEEQIKKAAGQPFVEYTKKLDINEIIQNAKNMYPEMLETAKAAKKSLNKTLIITTGLIAGAKLASMAIFAAKNSKNAKDQNSVPKSV